MNAGYRATVAIARSRLHGLDCRIPFRLQNVVRRPQMPERMVGIRQRGTANSVIRRTV